MRDPFDNDHREDGSDDDIPTRDDLNYIAENAAGQCWVPAMGVEPDQPREILQERIGAYHYTITEFNEVYIQDLLKPHDVPENRWEGRLIFEGGFDTHADAVEFLRGRVAQDLIKQAADGLKLLE